MVRGDASAIDARTDVYLLGATLHLAITGRPRHVGVSLTNVLASALVLVAMGWRSEAAQAGKRSMNEVLGYDAVLALVTVALIGVFRGPLLANRLGRQAAAVMVAMVIAEAISDGILWARGGDPRDAGAFSLLVIAGLLIGAGIGIDWRSPANR